MNSRLDRTAGFQGWVRTEASERALAKSWARVWVFGSFFFFSGSTVWRLRPWVPGPREVIFTEWGPLTSLNPHHKTPITLNPHSSTPSEGRMKDILLCLCLEYTCVNGAWLILMYISRHFLLMLFNNLLSISRKPYQIGGNIMRIRYQFLTNLTKNWN